MRKTIIVTYLVIGLLSCMAFPMAHAQPSPYHYAQRSSYPFGCRDVASKKEVGKHHLLVQYRSTVNMSAEEGAKKYTPDYDIMNLEIRDSFSRYYSSSRKPVSVVAATRSGSLPTSLPAGDHGSFTVCLD